ncbi:MAG: hypothetical protein COW73_06365 [Nitrospirae bacterium CG18_big_fil_WC_8_21_14_2_50_70_55]|nr:hypothetical protein [Deltaproteobacteria bacterium]OIP65796.1 MAG: hypothetical protein AUK30_03795 [Nitrospirae bacterium CG2_30_70_394]PIQ05242.1 MAG: hypothetical protein COW73_06365 [Nitrospirae bacterium CG18_big_fil_WC_8_21_14_2_50_70_55]PIU80085.1 MAG: hypothetical protein COS73_01135 [Nitrospirae bacterium CG06_land_8_20_14_3_00_70_43]PIW83000.1 MAG: hypothetical protein COZ96_05815 [Nitrospirae bacterium CG_4_8_14_3_um_filter_70_85]PIX83588.1 MAG: hypothetical protein COZ33_04705 
MPATPAAALAAAILRLLRPLVRICLRNGLPYGAFAELAKTVYVEVAAGEFPLAGRKQSLSRVSVLTGLSRKEVSRVRNLAAPNDGVAVARYNRAARVISGWVRDPAFGEPAGGPARLPVEGAGASFATLVKHYSGDVPPRAILDELVRVGAVELLNGGQVRLLARAYLPATGEVEKLAILGADTADLIATIDHNLRGGAETAWLQRKVAYDNLSEEAVGRFRPLAARRAQGLLEELDEWLATRDRDLHPAVAGSGHHRVGLGIYYFEDDLAKDE